MTKRRLIVLFSVATVLRLGFVWIAPAWYDENFTLIVSRLPFDRMLAAVAGDVHPPLWYLLLWPLGQLHAPIWVLRIPAALLSVLSVGIFWSILGALELSPRVRTAALVLMIIMPIQLYYALEARMYSLLEFLVLAAVLAMLRKQWGWLLLACTLMLYTQYYGVFYLAAICLAGLFWYRSRQALYLLLAVGLGSLILFTPWIPVIISQMSSMTGSYWMQFTGPGMALRVLFENLFIPPQNAVIQIPLMLAGYAWIFVALLYAWLHRNKTTGLVCLIAFLPFFFATVFSLVWQPVLHFRPLIGISPFLYILLAGPVDKLFVDKSFKPAFWITVNQVWLDVTKTLYASVFILPLLLICDGTIYANLRTAKLSGASIELAFVREHWQPGDIIYHFSDDSWVNTAADSDLPMYKAPDCGPTLGGLSPKTRLAIGQRILPLADLQFKRAWLFWSDSPLEPPCIFQQLIDLGLDPHRPLGFAASNEYIFEGLWLLEK